MTFCFSDAIFYLENNLNSFQPYLGKELPVMEAIAAKGLSKSYGERRALEGLTLSLPQGSVFGFLGPNGAGKPRR